LFLQDDDAAGVLRSPAPPLAGVRTPARARTIGLRVRFLLTDFLLLKGAVNEF
jgi:hypothetical protein